jgi:hypothetical protein
MDLLEVACILTVLPHRLGNRMESDKIQLREKCGFMVPETNVLSIELQEHLTS